MQHIQLQPTLLYKTRMRSLSYSLNLKELRLDPKLFLELIDYRVLFIFIVKVIKLRPIHRKKLNLKTVICYLSSIRSPDSLVLLSAH